ncbi:hypothetical protein [uncultured Nocardioides sp.]|uniref:hypothetical protein n=1 Tax=uncultured Nocardioides sp. TaxID=198441 RepID=UPI0026257747|nr:hypothetical protein [uncultured Nocardioides sp.]
MDGPLDFGRAPDRRGHRGDAGVRPGLGAEGLVELRRAGGDLDHDGRRPARHDSAYDLDPPHGSVQDILDVATTAVDCHQDVVRTCH